MLGSHEAGAGVKCPPSLSNRVAYAAEGKVSDPRQKMFSKFRVKLLTQLGQCQGSIFFPKNVEKNILFGIFSISIFFIFII